MEITNIKRELLHQHPNNVRKEYDEEGITELSDSVRANGILSPLVIVARDDGGYNVVAGNRRLLAAEKAGLEEVPCIISEMDDKEQASIMLVENMQRKNLSPIEEAQGIQMCLDLGLTEEELSKKTGFSKATIRHRRKLNELDQEILKDKVENGATIFDFIKLEKVKDIDTKNKLMKDIGTANFNYNLDNELRKEHFREWSQPIISALKEEGLEEFKGYEVWNYDKLNEWIDGEEFRGIFDDTRKRYYKVGYDRITVYAEKEKIEDDSDDNTVSEAELKRKKAEQERNERRERIKNIEQQMQNARMNFMQSSSLAMDKVKLNRWIAYAILWNDLEFKDPEREIPDFSFNPRVYKELTKNTNEEELTLDSVFNELAIKNHDNTLLYLIYSMLEVNIGEYRSTHYDWDGCYVENSNIDTLYGFLIDMGYKMSDEELAIVNGYHEAYLKDDDDEDD